MGVLTNDGLNRLWAKIKALIDKKVDSDYVASRGENLVTNGTCLLGNNKNFSKFTYDGSDTYYACGSFKLVSKNTMINNDEFIPVDTSAKYLLSYYIKNDNADARYYDMLVMYDIDKREIGARNVMWIVGSTTKLAKELKNGDTVVYLEDASGFNKTTTQSYHHGLIFWNYQNSKGYTYGTETYSRNRWDTLWDDGNAIDTTNNTITLKIPWNHGIFPEGTPVSQCSDGGTYTYMNSNYAISTGKWVQKKGSISGIGKRNEYYKFREGTAFIKIGWLLPYQCKTQTTTWLSTISLTQNASAIDVDSAKTELKTYADNKASSALTEAKKYADSKIDPSYIYKQSGRVFNSYGNATTKCGTTNGTYTNLPAFTTVANGDLGSLYSKVSSNQIKILKKGLYTFQIRAEVNSITATKRVEIVPFVNGERQAKFSSTYNTSGNYTIINFINYILDLNANDVLDFRIAPMDSTAVSVRLLDITCQALDWDGKFVNG